MKLLVTGGCGFIGSHFIRLLLSEKNQFDILNVDCVTYAGRGRNLDDLRNHRRYRFSKTDIASKAVHTVIKKYRPEAIVNFAAESHVDRSVHDASEFLRTNTMGVQNLLDAARANGVHRFVQVSTDEVYGSIAGKGRASETSPLVPSSPYSASKTAGDLCCQAAFRTHGQDIVITRCTNNYGPYQFPEKLIPLMITNALTDQPLPIYGDGLQRRDWIHVEDHCQGILLALKKGKSGEIYNFGMGSEPTNIMIVKQILKILGKSEKLLKYVKDRPGHDRRYAVSTQKANRELKWKPHMDFNEGLRKTVDWYCAHVNWWLKLKNADFQKFYKKNYLN